jgi:hypothetical protein
MIRRLLSLAIGLTVAVLAGLWGWRTAHDTWPQLVPVAPTVPQVVDQMVDWVRGLHITHTAATTTTPDLPSIPWPLVAVTAVTAAVAVGAVRSRRQARPAKWTTTRVATGFTRAGLTPPTGIRVRHHDDATVVTATLPAGLVASQVVTKREALAAALTVPLDRLTVGMAGGHPSKVELTIADPEPVLATRAATLPDTTIWRDPVLLGRDPRGRDVTAPVYDIGQWLVGGLTGSGKTTLLRLLAAHYALDPTTVIWGADGKGSRDDWAPLRGRVARWVDVTDDDSAAAYLTLIRDTNKEVAARNSSGGRDHPGMLVILEEATAFRAALDPDMQATVDKQLTRLVQTCRSANVLVVTAAQRPSSTLMSPNVRAQSGVGICMRVRSATDAEMVLGYRPTVPLPDAPGRALVDVGNGVLTRVLVDWLTDDAWTELGQRVTPPPPTIEVRPQDATLLTVAYDAVAAAGGRMTTAEILDAIPAGLAAAPGAAMLGRELTALGWETRVEWVGGKAVRYRYADDCRNAPCEAPVMAGPSLQDQKEV